MRSEFYVVAIEMPDDATPSLARSGDSKMFFSFDEADEYRIKCEEKYKREFKVYPWLACPKFRAVRFPTAALM